MDQDRRIATAQAAWRWISRADGPIAPSLLAGRYLTQLDRDRVDWATKDALALPLPSRIVEIVTPLTQIAAAILAGHGSTGPARNAAELLHIFDRMAARAWITADERALLGRFFTQARWDPRSGDGWAHCRAAGLVLVPVSD